LIIGSDELDPIFGRIEELFVMATDIVFFWHFSF